MTSSDGSVPFVRWRGGSSFLARGQGPFYFTHLHYVTFIAYHNTLYTSTIKSRSELSSDAQIAEG